MLQRLENSADLTTRMKELLNQRKIQERRLLRAFPKMRSDKHEALAVIKAKLEELKRDKTMK